jgi:hypothetical protein
MKSIYFLVVGLFLVGCGKDFDDFPKIEHCQFSNRSNLYKCHDPKKKKDLNRPVADLEGWTFMDKDSALNFLEACFNYRPQPARVQCLAKINSDNQLFYACFDGIDQRGFNISPRDAEGYDGVKFEDFIFLLNYCEAKREKHLAKKRK